jgi:hypothetical protein
MKLSLFCLLITCAPTILNAFNAISAFSRGQKYATFMTSLDDPRVENKNKKSPSVLIGPDRIIKNTRAVASHYDGAQDWEVDFEGFEGFDKHLEHARRMLEGPGFAPLRMTLWEPIIKDINKKKSEPPGFFDTSKILINNAFQMMGLAKSIDGAPLVQGVNTFKGSPLQLLSRVLDGNLQELSGGPLFLLLHDYYVKYGPVYKLAFGPKSFIVVSDPVMVKHILKVKINMVV